MPDVADAPPTDRTARRGRWWLRAAAVAAFVAGAVLLLRYEAGRAPDRVNGDAWEYWYQAESFHRHGTPELWPEDVAAVNGEAHRLGLGAAPAEPYAYAKSPDGRMYGVHFWAYALSVVPAKEYLRRAGGTELTALTLTNAAWFALAVGFAVFGSSAPVGERLALAALAAVGPVVWYLAWPGAELFSWALALIAVVAYRDRRYAAAGLAAGLAATQNPPLVFLGGAAVLAAAWERRGGSAVFAAAGTAVAFAPFAFFQYHFGMPNLIAAGAEYVGVGNVSLVRTWGLLTDFNHGLVPFAPVLVVGAGAGAVRLAYTRNVRGLILLAGGVGVALGVQVAHNWNSGCDGLQRYLVWMVPVAAGVAVEGLAGARRRLAGLAAVAVVAHAALLYAYDRTDALKDGYLNHTPLAAWVLSHHPRAYWVEPEVFIERTLQRDGWPIFPAAFPVGYAAPDGTVTKLLLDAGSVERVGQRYEVDPAYLAALRERAAGEPGLFYAHPPAGAVRSRPPAAAAAGR
jgi:hypothetical protein